MTDQKGEGLHSLGLKTFALCRPPIEPHKDHQTLLYRIIELIRRRIAEKSAPFSVAKMLIVDPQKTYCQTG